MAVLAMLCPTALYILSLSLKRTTFSLCHYPSTHTAGISNQFHIRQYVVIKVTHILVVICDCSFLIP